MPVLCPSRYGVVLRKSERTAVSIARLSRWRAQAAFMSQDEDLVAFSVASNPRDLQDESKTLREEGCAPSEDYVLTSHEDGVIGPLPAWLTLAPPALAVLPADDAGAAAQGLAALRVSRVFVLSGHAPVTAGATGQPGLALVQQSLGPTS